MQRKVSVYGLTTEGFGVARKLSKNADVFIIDEMLQTGFRFKEEFASGTLEQLMAEEPLLDLIPVEKAISQSRVVFFSPKLRRYGDEALVEASSKIRELSKFLPRGCAVVNTIPCGLGGNSEYIQIIEKQSGMKIGEDISYCYFPLRPGESWSEFFASTPGSKEALDELGLSQTSQNIYAAELEYVSELLESTLGFVSAIELNRKAREANLKIRQKQSPYIEHMVSRLYDLRAVQAREELSETIAYLAGSILKNLENFSRYLVDAVRDALRERSLKASRTKVVLLWSVDKYEIRPDRIIVSESIVQRLRDYVTDVNIVSSSTLRTGIDSFDKLKSNIVVLCSDKDAEEFMHLHRRNGEMIILHAKPDLGFY